MERNTINITPGYSEQPIVKSYRRLNSNRSKTSNDKPNHVRNQYKRITLREGNNLVNSLSNKKFVINTKPAESIDQITNLLHSSNNFLSYKPKKSTENINKSRELQRNSIKELHENSNSNSNINTNNNNDSSSDTHSNSNRYPNEFEFQRLSNENNDILQQKQELIDQKEQKENYFKKNNDILDLNISNNSSNNSHKININNETKQQDAFIKRDSKKGDNVGNSTITIITPNKSSVEPQKSFLSNTNKTNKTAKSGDEEKAKTNHLNFLAYNLSNKNLEDEGKNAKDININDSLHNKNKHSFSRQELNLNLINSINPTTEYNNKLNNTNKANNTNKISILTDNLNENNYNYKSQNKNNTNSKIELKEKFQSNTPIERNSIKLSSNTTPLSDNNKRVFNFHQTSNNNTYQVQELLEESITKEEQPIIVNKDVEKQNEKEKNIKKLKKDNEKNNIVFEFPKSTSNLMIETANKLSKRINEFNSLSLSPKKYTNKALPDHEKDRDKDKERINSDIHKPFSSNININNYALHAKSNLQNSNFTPNRSPTRVKSQQLKRNESRSSTRNNNNNLHNQHVLAQRQDQEQLYASKSYLKKINHSSLKTKPIPYTINENNENAYNPNENNFSNSAQTLLELDIPRIVNKNKPKNTVERQLLSYAHLSLMNKKTLLLRIRILLFLIDIFIIMLSGLIATTLYLDHFTMVSNLYKITSANNRTRIACYIGSMLQIVLLILRDSNIRARENIKYFLNYSDAPYVKSIITKGLIAEIFIHLLQPLPYVQYHFKMRVLGFRVTYSINMLLFLLCVLRFYYIYFIITQWMVFSSERSKRIIKFLVNGNPIIITFKAILKYYGLISLFCLFMTLTYLYSLVFKILEDFDRTGFTNFTEIVNCLWYIMITITTIGYGKYVPITMLGRVVGVFCSITGIFFIAMIFVFLVLYITLDDDENQAYKKIIYIYQKKDQSDEFNSYISSYIKYKFLKSRKGRTIESIQYKNKYCVLRNKYYYSLLRDTNDYQGTIIHSFSKKINDYWNDHADDIFYTLGTNIDSMKEELKKAVVESEMIFQLSLLSGTLSFKCLNLMNFNSKVGFYFFLNSISQIQGKKIISGQSLKKTENKIINDNSHNYRKLTLQNINNINNSKENANTSMMELQHRKLTTVDLRKLKSNKHTKVVDKQDSIEEETVSEVADVAKIEEIDDNNDNILKNNIGKLNSDKEMRMFVKYDIDQKRKSSNRLTLRKGLSSSNLKSNVSDMLVNLRNESKINNRINSSKVANDSMKDGKDAKESEGKDDRGKDKFRSSKNFTKFAFTRYLNTLKQVQELNKDIENLDQNNDVWLVTPNLKPKHISRESKMNVSSFIS